MPQKIYKNMDLVALGAGGASLKRHKLDLIGDVHGCYDELIELMEKLGYNLQPDSDGRWYHDEHRSLIFVGDLTDRGPNSLAVLDLVEKMVSWGRAVLVRGNHDDKLLRWLKGNRVQLGHGLQATVKEFLALPKEEFEERKTRYIKMLEEAPFWLLCDPQPQGTRIVPETLVVAHAAWKPTCMRKTTAFSKGYCLYGPTTGQMVNGLPQRLNWKPSYPSNAPLCVHGHTPYDGPVEEIQNTICLDTGCVFGARLTALRWPSKEIVQVNARQVWSTTSGKVPQALEPYPKLIDPEVASLKSDEVIPIGGNMDLRLDQLLQFLWSDARATLDLVDADPVLAKREVEAGDLKGVRLANASKVLYTPGAVHHLYAKGLVYKDAQVLSIPYVKLYNYGERPDATKLADDLAKDPDVTMFFNEKLDGTLIQTFSTYGKNLGDPKVVITTRSMLESGPTESVDFDFLGTARKLFEAQSPKALDPELTADLTCLWEFIYMEPAARSDLVTDYGDRKELVLTGAITFREGTPRYITRTELETLGETLECPVAPLWQLGGVTLKERIESLGRQLADSDLEGSVITFEGKGLDGRPQVLHRVKVKGQEYLRLMRLLVFCSYTQTREFLLAQPDLLTWEDFRAFLVKKGSKRFPEEVLGTYKMHFETYCDYLANLQSIVDTSKKVAALWIDKNPEPAKGGDDWKAWKKRFSNWVISNTSKAERGYVFSASNGKITKDRLDWQYNGSVDEAKESAALMNAALERLSKEN